MGILLNVTNHPSDQWEEEQLAAARKIGKIVDMGFPLIHPTSTLEEIQNLAQSMFSAIRNFGDPVVLIQGEATFTYQLVRILEEHHLRAVACCSTRVSEEHKNSNGETIKTSCFRFAGFRDYFAK